MAQKGRPGPGTPTRRAKSDPVIADLVEVAAVETVVRLDGRPGRLGELVVTDDVAAALGEVLAAAGDGGAFFLVAHFGAGKSHLLAALAELAGDSGDPAGRAGAGPLAGWPAGLATAGANLSGGLAVAVPLVEHRAGVALEDLVLSRAYRALGVPAPPADTDRRVAWDGLADAAAAAGRGQIAVLLDELSEFLRAKEQPGLTEDLRFLQFLGEWCRGRPVVVVAALQESIEEVANVSARELARIRDRYRTLTLSMRHVEDLVRGRLVRVRPGAEPLVERAHAELERAFPGWGVPQERLARCYPVHPATLALLEGLRFLFSQQRGVVDFVCRQLAGDVPAGIPPWQERPWLELLTPDRVYEHFAARLAERVETRRLAETVVPYWERAAPEVFTAEPDRRLALRATRLLCLLAASPVESPRSAAELAHLLLARVSALDPSANVSYFESAILGPLVARGAYVVQIPGSTGGAPRYTVEVEADAAVIAGARLRAARAELHPADRRVVGTLVELGSSPSLPLQLMADVGAARRDLLWQNTARSLVVGLVRVSELGAGDVVASVESARATGAAGVLLVAEPEPSAAEAATALVRATDTSGTPRTPGRLAVWVPAPFSAEEREVVLELHSRRLVLDAARAEGRTGPGDLVEFLERARAADAPRARELLGRAYFGGTVLYGEVGAGGAPGAAAPDLPSLAGLPFERSLVALGDSLLSRLHPRHRDVAPHGELVGERILRQLVTEAVPLTRISGSAAERGQLRSLVAGYLVPLGLFRKQRDGFVLAPDPARSPAVAQVLRLVAGDEPVPASEVMRQLADGPVGLSEPEGLLVLNGCVQAGLVEAWRGRRRHTEPFLAVTTGDRLSAGELLEPGPRAALAALAPVVGSTPLEPWNAALQRTLWERARGWLEIVRGDHAQARSGLGAWVGSHFGGLGSGDENGPGPGEGAWAVGSEALAGDVERVGALLETADPAAGPVAGLRSLVGAVGDAEATLRSARRLGALARFLREEATRAETAVAYLTHPRLEIPPGEERLLALRDEALAVGRNLLQLAAEDRSVEFSTAEQAFRRAYVAAYTAAHEQFYASAATRDAEAIRASGAYRALAALATLEAVAVPDDRVRLDRVLAAAVPPPCARRLDLELAWKPRCGCGFALGTPPPTVDGDALVAQAERGVAQYRAELARPEVAGRLAGAVDDLVDLGRDELAAGLRRLLVVATAAEPPDTQALAHLIDEPLAAVVRDVLGGASLVVRRDLATLREDVIGRRYPKRRLVELITAWVDPGGDLPPGGFVEVIDSTEAAGAGAGGDDDDGRTPEHTRGPSGGAGVGRQAVRVGAARAGGATAAFCALRFPSLAALLPADRAADAFWLAAWYVTTKGPAGGGDLDVPPPAWGPAGLIADPPLVVAAAEAALADLGARADLADLDARTSGQSLLGDQVAAALDLGSHSAAEVAAVLIGEGLLRHPLRLAADDLGRRLAGDWQLAGRVGDVHLARLATGHALAAPAEFAALGHVLAAAHHLADLERRLPGAGGRELVEDVYPARAAPVPGLLSRAEVAAMAGGVLSTAVLDMVGDAARRTLAGAGDAFSDLADAGFPGCLRIWEVGQGVIAPLLRSHGRVVVLLVDAMRVDLWHHVRDVLHDAVGAGRMLRESWAVVPEPTRTAESVAALYLGRPVPAGSAPTAPGDLGIPFSHLGVESAAVVGVDGDRCAAALRELLVDGPKVSVAVATGVDGALHRSTAELSEFLDAAAGGLARRVLPALAALPPSVPLVVLADHGFRENHGAARASGRYAHGGRSLEECVVPVAVFAPAGS